MSSSSLVVFVAVIVAVAAALEAGPPSYELYDYNPVADPNAVVKFGNARFTVLTDQLIRMEYSPSGAFEDRPTLAFVNRNLAVPKFTQSTSGSTVTITTANLNLQYTSNGPFSATNLVVSSIATTPSFKWNPGMDNSGNLLGTIKSLDDIGAEPLNCTLIANKTVHDESLHCEWGLISKLGWSVVDDTKNYGLTKGAEWWDSYNTDAQDWYFFGHGLNYKQAIADYTKVGGVVPIVPRYALGIWWTRWFDLNNFDVRKLVHDYESRSIPLDVFILDMDWHQKNAWGGYTWDNRLFPYPANTLGWLKNKGLRIGANLHDADGVNQFDAEFVPFCEALGINPNSTAKVQFSVVNQTYMYALEDIVLKPVEEDGMDFWWIDYQQGGTTGGCTGLKQNPTIWTDKIRCTDSKRRGGATAANRNMVLARWGGLGNHRYQVGFSGDVDLLSWGNLAYQPYFSLTAANVAYGFWSHDIEGPASDFEMYTRWLQWGAVSGIMRSHDRGMSAGQCNDVTPPTCSHVRIWDAPTRYFEPMRAALQLRESLIPYLYTAAREAFETGLGLLRPMYYEFGAYEMAYAADAAGNFGQYFFGPDMFISPVTAAASASTSMTTKEIFIPPGSWVETVTGAVRIGNAGGSTVLTKDYDISEIPIFVRAGAIIARNPVVTGQTTGQAGQAYSSLIFDIYPGAASGSVDVYEDDGATTAYLQNTFSKTTVSYARTASSLTVTIITTGTYVPLPQRLYTINIINSLPPTSVSFNNKPISYNMMGGSNTWMYDGNEVSLLVSAMTTNVQATSTFVVGYDAAAASTVLSGLKGMLRHAVLAKSNLDEARATPGESDAVSGELQRFASTGDALSYLAATDVKTFLTKVNNATVAFDATINEVSKAKASASRLGYSINLLKSATV